MADGAYDSGGGDWGGDSSDWGGGGYYGGGGEIPNWVAILVIVIMVIYFGYQCSEKAAHDEVVAQERILDKTRYHEQAKRNFKEFINSQPYVVHDPSVPHRAWVLAPRAWPCPRRRARLPLQGHPVHRYGWSGAHRVLLGPSQSLHDL